MMAKSHKAWLLLLMTHPDRLTHPRPIPPFLHPLMWEMLFSLLPVLPFCPPRWTQTVALWTKPPFIKLPIHESDSLTTNPGGGVWKYERVSGQWIVSEVKGYVTETWKAGISRTFGVWQWEWIRKECVFMKIDPVCGAYQRMSDMQEKSERLNVTMWECGDWRQNLKLKTGLLKWKS